MKALDEIYNICRLLHRSDLKISAKKVVRFFSKFRVFQNFPSKFAIFTFNVDEILSEFRDTSQKMPKTYRNLFEI